MSKPWVAGANRKRVKHGATVGKREGTKLHSTYAMWCAITQRCSNPNYKHYHRYGGRGITMYSGWVNNYEAFYSHVGDRPKGMTLDRIDNNKGYEPNNVRWTTRKEQANNRSTNVVITHAGKTLTLMQWATELGWMYGLIASRWKKGLRGEELFVPPEYERGKTITFNGVTKTFTQWAKDTGVPYATLKWRCKHGKPLL